MEEDKNYLEYDLAAFASDEAFQNWVLCHKDNDYWEKVRKEYPAKKDDINGAMKLLLSLKFKEEWPVKAVVDKHLDEALRIIEKGKKSKVVSLFWRWAAAAVMIIAGVWIFMEQRGAEGLLSQKEPKGEVIKDIAPGGNKAVLLLADGRQIILDSASNGMLSEQGGVTVIKLDDGELSYRGKAENGDIVYNKIITPKGGQYHLILTDGTKVWLNAESSLRFPVVFHGEDRKVELTGEGYFEVARNESAPFYVNVGKMSVKVFGTHFNVNAYADENAIKTTLLEGKVEVNNQDNKVVLKPGEQARLQTSSQELHTTNNVDINAIMAWKNNEFLFNETELRDAMRQLSRWYDFEVVYENQIPPTYLYGTIRRDKTLTDVLKIMEASGLKFRIEKEGAANKLIVLK